MKPKSLFSLLPVIVWLFTQLVMTGIWATDASAVGSAEFGGRSIVICTGDGIITVQLDEGGNIVEGENGKPQVNPCPWCTSFSAPPTLTATFDLLPFSLGDGNHLQYVREQDHSRAQNVTSNAHIRAPPASL